MVATNPAITGMIRTSHPERPGPGSRKRRASVRQRTERQAATGHNPCDDQRGRPAGCRTATSGMRGSPPPPRISTHHLLEQVAPMVHRILILPRVAVDAKILQDMLGRCWNAPFELEWLTSLQAGMARPACGAIGSVPVEPCLDDWTTATACRTSAASAPWCGGSRIRREAGLLLRPTAGAGTVRRVARSGGGRSAADLNQPALPLSAPAQPACPACSPDPPTDRQPSR